MSDTDLVVDQLYSDTPMTGVAMEASAMGKACIMGGYGFRVLEPFTPQEFKDIVITCDPDEIKEAKRVSNLSFNVDRRSESQRKAYENGQALKRRAREEKILYERYRLALGDKVPKTLASFTSIKRKDGEAWQELKKLYRQVQLD
jgi:hypothetical protein